MKNYKDKLTKLEIISNKIFSEDGLPTVKLTHSCWNTKHSVNGIIDIPETHSFGIYIMGDQIAHLSTFEELQETLINILAE